MKQLKQLFVHLPASDIAARLPLFIAAGWYPEIALQCQDLEREMDFARIGGQLHEAQLTCCIHAPFFDLNPASNDPKISAITRLRFEQTLDVAQTLNASHIVFHPGFDPWRYARAPEAWLEYSLKFWPELIGTAAQQGIVLCLENIFDTEPDPLCALLREIDSPHFQHCFDIGHWYLFSKTPLDEWLELFSPYLHHLHLHDNRGRKDDHRPIGAGKIDFSRFFDHLAQQGLRPTATLEAHRQKDVEKSLRALHDLLRT